MRKIKHFVVVVMLLALVLLSTGCAAFQNEVANQGGLLSSNGDYIIVNSSGGIIQDVWKLRGVIVTSPDGSDGWVFQDQSGNSITIGGDSKTIRLNKGDTTLWNMYQEYHYEFETKTYQELYGTAKSE